MTDNLVKIRAFYESLYRKNRSPNPAYAIYDRLRVETIRQLIDNYGGKVLIVGCGANQDANILNKSVNVFVFDLSWHAVHSISSSNIIGFVGDACGIPLSKNYFDLIICSEVLEHIPNIKRAVEELFRVIKPNGILIVSSPNWLSFFGFARWLLEKLTKKAVHSSGQPYDDWKTIWKYKSELSPHFVVESVRGVWYLPPFHYDEKGLSKPIMDFIFKLYEPLERLFSKYFPIFGHIIVLRTRPNK